MDSGQMELRFCKPSADANDYAYANAYAYADANAYAYADANDYAYANAYADAYANAYANDYADAYAYAYAYANAYADAYANAYDYANAYADAYDYAHANAYAYADDYANAEHFFAGLLEKKNTVNDSLLAFYCSDKDGRPSNGGSGTVAYPGAIHEIAGPLKICGPKALHATFDPSKWKGERLWLVRMYAPYVIENDKVGSLKREIVSEIGQVPRFNT